MLPAEVRPDVPGAVSLASEVYPLRVWYDPLHDNSTAIAPEVMASLERAWEVQVDEIGFRAPVLPDAADGPELDVYLADYQRNGLLVAPDGAQDDVPGDGYSGTSAYVVLDRELSSELVAAWSAHALQHVLQYATDFTEQTLPIREGTATAAQGWTFGAAGRWDRDVQSYQEAPAFPALTADSGAIFPRTGRGEAYEQGAALWVMFVDEKLVGESPGAGGLALWEAAASEGGSEPDAVDAFAALAFSGLGEALNELAVVRFLTGRDWDARGLSEAAGWGPEAAVPAAGLRGDELPLSGLRPDPPPMITGQSFFDFDLRSGVPAAAGMAEPWLSIRASSASGLSSGLVAMTWDGPGVGDDLDAVGLQPEIALPLGEVGRLVVALTNLGPPGWDGDDPGYVPGDQILEIALFDRGAVDEPGETTSSTPSGGGAGEGSERGCGCAETPSRPSVLLPALLLALYRSSRTRARRPSGAAVTDRPCQVTAFT